MLPTRKQSVYCDMMSRQIIVKSSSGGLQFPRSVTLDALGYLTGFWWYFDGVEFRVFRNIIFLFVFMILARWELWENLFVFLKYWVQYFYLLIYLYSFRILTKSRVYLEFQQNHSLLQYLSSIFLLHNYHMLCDNMST